MSVDANTKQNELDCRGLACPQPVILTKKALDHLPAELTVLVDNVAAKENVAKFASANGYGVSIEQGAGLYRLRLVAGASVTGITSQPEMGAATTAAAILLTRNT